MVQLIVKNWKLKNVRKNEDIQIDIHKIKKSYFYLQRVHLHWIQK